MVAPRSLMHGVCHRDSKRNALNVTAPRTDAGFDRTMESSPCRFVPPELPLGTPKAETDAGGPDPSPKSTSHLCA